MGTITNGNVLSTTTAHTGMMADLATIVTDGLTIPGALMRFDSLLMSVVVWRTTLVTKGLLNCCLYYFPNVSYGDGIDSRERERGVLLSGVRIKLIHRRSQICGLDSSFKRSRQATVDEIPEVGRKTGKVIPNLLSIGTVGTRIDRARLVGVISC